MKFKITLFFLFAFCSVVLTAQVANQPNDLILCDDASDGDDANGFVQSFMLNSQDSEILGSQSSSDFTVTYHNTQADAENGSNALSSPYSNTTANAEVIFARVTDNNNSNFDTTSFNIIVSPLPTGQTIVELKQCDDDTDGFISFNLQEAGELISNNFANEFFEFYETQTDAQNEVNAIPNATTYTNQTPTSDAVWARTISTEGCFRVSQVDLIVATTSTQLTNFPPRTYSSCDDFLDIDGNDTTNNDDTDGVSSFDFSGFTADIIAVFPASEQPLISIAFYRNEADALAELNAISDPSNYRNIGFPNTQQIYVRADNSQNNECIGLFPLITLEVDPVPVANQVSNLELCDNSDDGANDNGIVQTFNLDVQTPLILGGQSATGYTVTYHVSASDAGTGANAITSTTAYTNITPNLQTIYVRVTNNTDGCFTNHTSFKLIVNSVPTANFVPDLEVCDDDLDGFAAFDLTSLDDEITNGEVDLSVSYYASFADATSAPTH